MAVKIDEFIGRFKEKEVQSAEIRLTDTLDYYIVQKHDGKVDLYTDREMEYKDDLPLRKSKEVIGQEEPMGITTEFGSIRGLFSITKHPHRKEAELVKHLKNIEDIGRYIDFESVSEVIYEKK